MVKLAERPIDGMSRRNLLASTVLLLLVLLSACAAYGTNNFVYEIFVRSFFDANNDPKHIGDLQGIVAKLDPYLNDGKPDTDHDLEVGVLWLMPVFPSPSYHGYDVTDFRAINPDYGTLNDFKTLVQEAHQRGVRIIVDLPVNHSSDEHPWFKEAINDSGSPRRKLYHIKPDSGSFVGPWHRITSPSGEKLRYLGAFNRDMPDFDFDNTEVRREMSAIARFWLDLGVDGFRLDAAKHIYGDRLGEIHEPEILKNNDFWREFSHAIYRQKQRAILAGEVLGERELLRRHAWGLDGLLDEPFMNDLRSQIGFPTGGFVKRYKDFVNAAAALNRTAHEPSLPFPDQPFHALPFVGSHDRNPRVASDFEEKRNHGMSQTVEEACALATYVLLTLGTHPVVYSGDELMQRGWKWRGNPANTRHEAGDGSGIYDETLREPFPWYTSGAGPGQTTWFSPRFDKANDGISHEEQNSSGSVFDVVRGLANFRSKHAVFSDGELGTIASDTAEWMVFERTLNQDRYLVLINLTSGALTYRFHETWFPEYRRARLLFWSDGKSRQWKDESAKTIDDSVFVPGNGLVVIKRG